MHCRARGKLDRNISRLFGHVFVFFGILMFLASSTGATEWERRWDCGDLTLYMNSYLDSQWGHGKIVFDGIEINTGFMVAGLHRYWFWGLGELEGEEGSHRYSIRLDAGSGTLGSSVARYYDYADADDKGITKPRMNFYCD